MKHMKLPALTALILALVFVAAACTTTEPAPTATPTPAETEAPRVNQSAQQNTDGMEDKPAPDFTLKGFDDQDRTLSQYYDNVVVLNFWAVGCPPCVNEMPDLDEINNLDYVTVVTVAPNGILGNEYDSCKDFIGKFGTEALWDDTRSTQELYSSQGFPHSYIIDRTGTIRYSILGGQTYEYFKERVDKVNDLG